MKPTSLFLGACALACIAGAVGGMTTNTVPIDRAGIGSAELGARSQVGNISATPSPVVLAPDRYALETPAGRIEVAELANHGLYSQARFGYEHEEIGELAPGPVEAIAEIEPSPAPLDPAEPAPTPSNYARTVDFPSDPPVGT